HQQERGYHNYESPTAWEVRLGHLSIDAAREELKPPQTPAKALKILNSIGYSPKAVRARERWTVYYLPKAERDRAAVGQQLHELLEPLGAVELLPMAEPEVSSGKPLLVSQPTTRGLETGTLPLFHAQERQAGREWKDVEGLWQALE